MSSPKNEWFLFKDTQTQTPLTMKVARHVPGAVMNLKNIEIKSVFNPGQTRVDLGSLAPAQQLAVAKIDFIYSILIQISLMISKYDSIFQEPKWDQIVFTSQDPKATSSFLKSEQDVLRENLVKAFDKLNRKVDRLPSMEELIRFRKHFSRTYVVGRISNALQGMNNDL